MVNKIKYIENKRIEVTNVEKDINENDDTDLMKEEMEEKDKKDPKVEESVENNKNHINKKEINYDLSLKL